MSVCVSGVRPHDHIVTERSIVTMITTTVAVIVIVITVVAMTIVVVI